MAYQEPGTAPVEDYLRGLSDRLEFREAASEPGPRPGAPPPRPIPGFQPHALQAFVERFMAPDAPVTRFFLGWDTGSGKTIAALMIAQKYVQLYRQYRHVEPEARPTVYILGFTRSIIQAEMLRTPQLGFVTHTELRELRRLYDRAQKAGPGAPEQRQYNGFMGTLKRQITDRYRGGYYKFFGYKEFAARLFVLTPKGERAGLRLLDLFLRRRKAPNASEPAAETEVGGDADGGAADAEGAETEETSVVRTATIVANIIEAEKAGYLYVNSELLRPLKNGLIVADEIHNTYNIHNPNMYGVAIQFALDAFAPQEAPRAVFMSATPMSGSSTELVDFLNLLVPRAELPAGRPLAKADLFAGQRGSGLAYQPGALDLVSRLTTGRVSFLTEQMDSPHLFPSQTFEGDEVVGTDGRPLPYLRFVQCPLSALQTAALADFHGRRPDSGRALPPPADYALYDCVFPAPPSGEDGSAGAGAGAGDPPLPLYTSTGAAPLYGALAAAPDTWKARVGVKVLARSQAGGRTPVVSGAFLALPALERYSSKYARFVRDLHAFLGRRAGKAFVYHDRVQLTGVAFLGEVLRNNGFVELGEPANDATLCARCGRARQRHPKGHDYTPAVFVAVTGEMDRSAQGRVLGYYNHPNNLDGSQIRVLLGSMVVIQGLNFSAVRLQMVLSIPQDISTLVQILGRTSRRGSHAALPPEERRVEVRIYLQAAGEGAAAGRSAPAAGPPPDREKVTRLLRDYLLIQEGVAALRRTAVNGFLPQSRAVADAPPALRGLPFDPPVAMDAGAAAAGRGSATATYYAYEGFEADTARAALAARALFADQPVWRRADLVAALGEPGRAAPLPTNPAYWPPGVAETAVDQLLAAAREAAAESFRTAQSGGGRTHLVQVTRADGAHCVLVARALPGRAPGDDVLVAAPLDDAGVPLADVETYARGGGRAAAGAAVDLAEYAGTHLVALNFERRLADFEARWGEPGATRGPAGARFAVALLTEYDAAFHYALLELLITRKRRSAAALAALAVYDRFRVVVTRAEAKRAAAFLAGGLPPGAAPHVGYVMPDHARLWTGRAWSDVPLRAIGRGDPTQRPENSVVVGYMGGRGGDGDPAGHGRGGGGAVRFKIRAPLQVLARQSVRDARSLARGAACETRPRGDLAALVLRLTRRKAPAGATTGELCARAKAHLVEAEAAARRPAKGVSEGVRWFYLFNERRPLIQALAKGRN